MLYVEKEKEKGIVYIYQKDICQSCCGLNRSWEKCPTKCTHFKKEKEPKIDFKLYEVSLKNESTGEQIKGIESFFIANVYEAVNCKVKNLSFNFLSSNTVEIHFSFILEAPHDIFQETYLKDDWKRDFNWGPYNLDDFNPLLFIFGDSNSKFFHLKTSITIDGHKIPFKESNAHYSLGLPLSTIKIEKKPTIDNGKQVIEEIQWIEGSSFSGYNSAVFTRLGLNKTIRVKKLLTYQNLSIDSSKEINFPIKILIPFKNVKFEKIEYIPPVDFAIEERDISIYSPKKSIRILRAFIQPVLMNKFDFGKKEIKSYSNKLNISDYKLLKFDFKLVSKSNEEALGFVTSYPIPSSIYSGIYKLYPEKFSPAKVIISNFSNSTSKFSVISKIHNLSNTFEKDVIVGPFKQKELRIKPILDQNRVKELHNPLETSLSIKVQLNNKDILRMEEEITVLAKDTIIWEVEDPGRTWNIDLRDLIVSWITPNIPEVDTIISSAARLNGSMGAFNDDISMEKEIKAIYDVISEDIRYVNRPFSFGSTENVFTQRVLTPKQTIKEKSGNCIDLSVLFASCLESCGIEPLIIMVPGHAFVGWKGYFSSNYMESTLLGRSNFETAKRVGKSKYDEFFSGNNIQPRTREVDVELIRKKGIYPPPWF